MGITNYPCGVDGSHAYFNDDNPPECLNSDCMCTLEPDWEFCPSCGWHIDWDAINSNDDYAGVSKPLVMHSCS